MKHGVNTVLMAVAALVLMSAPAEARGRHHDNNDNADNASSNQRRTVLGSGDNAPRWSQGDVTAMCQSRYAAGGAGYQNCVKRNKTKIGRPQTPGDVQELSLNRPPEKTKKKSSKNNQ